MNDRVGTKLVRRRERDEFMPTNMSGAFVDLQLMHIWLKTKQSPRTREAYEADARNFLKFLSKRKLVIRTTTVADVQAWVDTLKGAPATRSRKLASVKSFIGFANKTGYVQFNVAQAVPSIKIPDPTLQRLLSEEEVSAIIEAADPGREQTILRFLYNSGLRAREACSLRWEHVTRNEDGAVITVFQGKGNKTRHVAVTEKTICDMEALRGKTTDGSDPIFTNREGRVMNHCSLFRLVRKATKRTNINKPVSPHWFRHSHASHALNRGAPVHLVQQTLGHASLVSTTRYVHANPDDSSSNYLPPL